MTVHQESRTKLLVGLSMVTAGLVYAGATWSTAPIAYAARHALGLDVRVVAMAMPPPPMVAPPIVGNPTQAELLDIEARIAKRVLQSVQAEKSWLDYMDRIVAAIVSLSGAYVLVYNARKRTAAPVVL